MIQVSVGDPIKTAEGTTLILDKTEVTYAGKAKLDYSWQILSGPKELISIANPKELKPRVVIKDLQNPVDFVLRITVTDRQSEATADLKVSVFPAKLTLVKKLGGSFVGIKHMGEKWVAARGNTLLIFDPSMAPLATVVMDRPISQFFATVNAAGQGAIYVQSPEGQWAVLQSDSESGNKKSELLVLGRNIRRVVPFELDQQPYMFALLERSIDLWNLSDVKHPKLKTSLGTFLKDPLFLTFFQRNLYVAEEDSLHLIDFSTGNLVASIPSGGSITGLATYSFEGKNYLLASIGADRTRQGRKDYGLRVFEIEANGSLGSERRLNLSNNVPVERLLVIPGAEKVLLSVQEKSGLALRMVDLRQLKEIPVTLNPPINFLALDEFETGKINGSPVAVLADSNQLRILDFKAVGTPPQQYTISEQKDIAGVVSATWIQSLPDGSRLWIGDSGTVEGGALAVADGQDLNFIKALDAPDASYPVAADLVSETGLSPLLYISEEPKNLAPKEQEGLLGLSSNDPKLATQVELSAGLFGSSSPQGVLRPLGIAGRTTATGLRIAVAISRISGTLGGAGLAVLEKPKAQSIADFLHGAAAKGISLISLQDARDVALSADGKMAFVAAGTAGLISIDLDQKTPMARMSLGTTDWVADRVLLSHQGDMVLALFIKPSTRQSLIKIFGVTSGGQMAEYGSIAGLSANNTVAGLRAPQVALTQDDLYLFVPTQEHVLSVFNLSNPAAPLKIVDANVEGEIRGVAIANRFKDVFLALGPAGIAKLEFGF
jgi:hypothetical protein